MFLQINVTKELNGSFIISLSKPETQRILISAVLSNKKQCKNPLNCNEVTIMRRAYEKMGVKFI